MNNIFNLKNYQSFIQTQEVVPGQNFNSVIIKDVMPAEELQNIQKQFEDISPKKVDVQGYAGLGTIEVHLNKRDEIIKKIEQIASNLVGEELEVLEFGGTIYSPEFGWYPKLGPHYDARPVEMYVFDYHVSSTQDWSVIVEGEEFTFTDNQALLFSGTGKIHWRDPIKLKDGAKVNLIFFWLQHKTPKPVLEKHAKIMKERATKIVQEISAPPGLQADDWWKPIKISDAALEYTDFIKISIDKNNPLSHNTLYKSLINEKQSIFLHNIKINKESNIKLPENLYDKLNNFMQHVHSEFQIKFKEAKIIKLLEQNIKLENNNSKEKILSLAIPYCDVEILVNDAKFTVPRFDGLSFSYSHQNIEIKKDRLELENNDSVLILNFLLIENDDQ